MISSVRAGTTYSINPGSDLKAIGQETAREILAEVLGVKLSEVDEMIENRFQAGEERCSREDGLWPQELWVER